MWEDLKNRFTQGNGPRIFQLQKDLSVLTQEDLSVRDYYTRFKSLWDELLDYNQIPTCTCGALRTCKCDAIKIFLDYQDRQHVIQFLMGLNDCFSHIRGQILMLEPLPNINKVFSLIVQEEKQREISKHNMIDTAAFMSKVQDTNPAMKRFAPGKQQQKRDKLFCTHCGMNNHTVDKCYKVHGYPPGFKQNSTNFRQKGRFTATANQLSGQILSTPFENFNQMPFSQEDYQKLLSLIHPQPDDNTNHQAANIISNSIAHSTQGTYPMEDDWDS
ncbi:uncharacterized protein LOC122282896 [Carya illinoinensis]|uniref:uncharacterized protein LOC122282896 n=1 Tax=Carya illinoinensis TaxID=32201 RepID=UPI001C719078|nr:uncharacterized protein LOC122282896 [Carya illinoinensis]